MEMRKLLLLSPIIQVQRHLPQKLLRLRQALRLLHPQTPPLTLTLTAMRLQKLGLRQTPQRAMTQAKQLRLHLRVQKVMESMQALRKRQIRLLWAGLQRHLLRSQGL